MNTFGPIPSRRLGRSLGINNLELRTCTYACVYCQAGQTRKLTAERSEFTSPEVIADEVTRAVESLRTGGDSVDVMTFVPDGEPTLDRQLGAAIRQLKPLGIRIAVITNGTLLFMSEVREDLQEADWVSVKVDTVDPVTWHRMNRPHGRLDLTLILAGVRLFARDFGGTLVTETMLVQGINDAQSDIARTAGFIADLSPAVSYLSIPVRPPAEPWVRPPDERTLVMAYEGLRQAGLRVRLLTGPEAGHFGSMGDIEQSILNTVAVHPMRAEVLERLLRVRGGDPSVVTRLVSAGYLRPVFHNAREYYVRGDKGPAGRR